MIKMKKLLSLILVGLLSLTVLSGCATNEDGKETVQLGYVNWAEGIAMTHLVATILEDKMGYDVDLTLADVAPIFTSVASGNTDAFLDVWAPVTHKDYIEKYGDDMDFVGTSYDSALIGLIVPTYVDIDSVDELNDNIDLFDGQIIGIDSGAGLMGATENAIEEYDLDYTLLAGSDVTMTAALNKAIDANEPIVVTGWKPHWKFSRFDLKVLEDPKGIFGAAEEIQTVTRKGLSEDMPDVVELLANFKLTDEQLSELLVLIEDSEEDIMVVARNWMNDNEEVVNEWIPASN
ncbi:glycine/betaine ABC transporter [Alkalibaculum sp. M08DMB]|uniref:Glycine/betaine ABC transporter n=1 Tax=Alkalibaculum sporogenes TaxID=2655001 RepID=A0A6A7K8I0_9FIRM|nr:glycine betaine ABC transporter substrate-binding protein [Alkalibaculum sporogenes]MPW25819.1 glycine/betaine ABC transporter [Alkalibaculum sporogenes]